MVCFSKDVKVPVKARRTLSSVGTSCSNIYLSWLLARSRMTQARFAGQGQNFGRAGRGPGNGQGQGRGRGTGYTSKPKTSKVGLCKELENNVFKYGIPNAADLLRTTQEKIGQYVGIKYGEDIANELTNKATVTIPPPVYSTAILLRHQEWERHVRRKQLNMRTALDAKLAQLQSTSGIQDAVPLQKSRIKSKTLRIIRAGRCPTTSQIQRSSSTGTRARRTAKASLLWRNIVAMCMHSFTDSAHKSCRTK